MIGDSDHNCEHSDKHLHLCSTETESLLESKLRHFFQDTNECFWPKNCPTGWMLAKSFIFFHFIFKNTVIHSSQCVIFQISLYSILFLSGESVQFDRELLNYDEVSQLCLLKMTNCNQLKFIIVLLSMNSFVWHHIYASPSVCETEQQRNRLRLFISCLLEVK